MKVPTRLVVLDRFPDEAQQAWDRLIRDVVGGGSAASALITALDASAEPLLEGVDVDAALVAADGPFGDDPRLDEPAAPCPRIDLLPIGLDVMAHASADA